MKKKKRIIPKCKSENDVIKPHIAGADYENFKWKHLIFKYKEI